MRAGEHPKTDLSYIFVYAYELINLVGCRDPQDGYGRLMDVYLAYRQTYPALDRYLSAWISDFLLAYGVEPPRSEANAFNLLRGFTDPDRLGAGAASQKARDAEPFATRTDIGLRRALQRLLSEAGRGALPGIYTQGGRAGGRVS